MTNPSASELRELRNTVGESLNVYQASVAMLSIFLGFVFAGLLQVLSGAAMPPLTVVVALVVALLGLMTALLLFHLTAHQVFRFWEVFFPDSSIRTMAGIAMNIGLIFMFLTVGALLRHSGMKRTGAFVPIYGVGLILFVLIMHIRLLHGSKHVVWVGRGSGVRSQVQPRETSPPATAPSADMQGG